MEKSIRSSSFPMTEKLGPHKSRISKSTSLESALQTRESIMSTRGESCPSLGQEAPSEVVRVIEEAKCLFQAKNDRYRRQDELSAFHEGAAVKSGLLSPFQYALTLCSKQDDAVWAYVRCPTEGRREELRERLMDGIVYRAILIALLNEEE